MLFLAVFCGFLAENQREHMVERNREKEFMTSLVKDLQLDTSQVSRIRIFRLGKLRTLDTIIVFFANHAGEPVPFSMYALSSRLFGHAGFFQNSGTLDQLKTSGGFRLIRRRNVVDSIEAYDQQIKRISLRDLYETNFSIDHNKLQHQLFDGIALLQIFADSTYYNKHTPLSATVKLNTQYLDEYLNSLRTYRFLIISDMDLQAVFKERAVRLITLIKREYHLK
jgi:hypothetical protein